MYGVDNDKHKDASNEKAMSNYYKIYSTLCMKITYRCYTINKQIGELEIIIIIFGIRFRLLITDNVCLCFHDANFAYSCESIF